MLNSFFRGIFDSASTVSISPAQFLLCVGAALLAGLLLAFLYHRQTVCTRSFLVTLAILPGVVCVVILMVNGNLGAGVAVAGTFSLVRFRSAPGTAREIAAIFIAMGSGLTFGMGYLGYGFLFTAMFGIIGVLYSRVDLFGAERSAAGRRVLRITIPEDLDYSTVFDDLFERYTDSCRLEHVKTTNLGSLFRLTYHITLKSGVKEKDLIDELRCRNGNLEISTSHQESASAEL